MRFLTVADRLRALESKAIVLPWFVRDLHGAVAGALSEIALPDLSGAGKLLAFSDYSDRLGEWQTATILVVPEQALIDLAPQLDAVRVTAGIPDGRRIEYKSLQEKLRWRAVGPWLEAFNAIDGVVFTLTAHRDVVSALRSDTPGDLLAMVNLIRGAGLGDWGRTRSGPRLLEASLRMIYCLAFWHAVLAGSSVPLHWISDNDEILAGQDRRRTAESVLPDLLHFFTGKPVKCQIEVEDEIRDNRLRDFLSIPDIVSAGVLEHQRLGDTDPMIAKAAVVMEWMMLPPKLAKVAFRLEHVDGRPRWTLYKPIFVPQAMTDSA